MQSMSIESSLPQEKRGGLESEDIQGLMPPPNGSSSRRGYWGSGGPSSALCYHVSAFWALLCAYLLYFASEHRLEFVLACILLFCIILAVSGVLEPSWNAHSTARMSGTDWYSMEPSKYESMLHKVDHWCIGGSNDGCEMCDDPLKPVRHKTAVGWMEAHESNVDLIDEACGLGPVHSEDDGYYNFRQLEVADDWLYEDLGLDDDAAEAKKVGPDVVFYGDSITEERAGRYMGKALPENLMGANAIFKEHFASDGAAYHGLALGITGDTAPNLLWRLKHNELPSYLDPNFYWVTIGTNDLAFSKCSAEVTLLGILGVVEEIEKQKPHHRGIIINSVLPITADPDGFLEGRGKRRPKGFDYWPTIKSINGALKRFAETHESRKMFFFDATNIFTERRDNGNTLFVRKDFFRDHLHPKPEGQKKWLEATVAFLDKLKRQRKARLDAKKKEKQEKQENV